MAEVDLKNINNSEWTPNKAYAVGLITTDGNLSKDGRHIVFVSKDKTLVKLFRQCLSLKNKISVKTSGFSKGKGKYYSTQFGNREFYKELLAIGLCPNKSKVLTELRIPNHYFPDFLRGHLDGDGTFKVYNDPAFPNCRRLYTVFVSASKKHLFWLRSKILELYGIDGRLRPATRAWCLTYAKEASKKLLLVLYYKKDDLPVLLRKRRLIEDFLN
jgi:hypothetical protein